MKYSNMMNYSGLIIIITSAIMKVFPLGLEQISENLFLMTGFILAYIGQSWKVSLLQKEIRNRKSSKLYQAESR